ncbi:MAG: AraC family transcriptional regulator [Lentisphaeraceae bacterium]|nr:AraC family transcriptional regulator [Lentisphaeraceae bacterium]
MNPYKEKVIFKEGASFLGFRRRNHKYSFVWHIHPEFEIVFLLKGKGTRYIGNSVMEYESSELVFIPPGVPHSWVSAEGSDENDAYVVHFDADCFGQDWFCNNELKLVKELMTSDSAILIENCKGAETIFENLISSRGLKKVAHFFELLDFILEADRKTLGSFRSEEGKVNNKLDRVITHLNENFKKELNAQMVADTLSMSPYQLRSLFAKYTNKTVLQYINELRVFEACRLMQNEQYTISYLASMAGFNNLSYFNRTFLKVTGMTPREYRRTFCP